MKHFFKEYFTFTKSERKGIVVLLTIVLILLTAPRFFYFFKGDEVTDFSKFQKEFAEFQNAVAENKVVEAKKDPVKLFPFDPNLIAAEKWRLLGLKDRQIKIIRNYISKGGRFYKKKDFKKIYGISADQYAALEPYIVIKKQERTKKSKVLAKREDVAKKKPEPTLVIELNTSQPEDLEKLKGIGSVYAQRIVKYRNLLGGFVEKKQLLEVYGIKQELYQQIEMSLVVDSMNIKKIDLNTAEFKDLIRHPYIDKDQVKAILNYKKGGKKFLFVEELTQQRLISEEVYRRVYKYLTVK